MNYTAKEHIWVDAKGNVVPEGDPNASQLLLAAGDEMPEERARELGLLKGRLVVREEVDDAEPEAKAEAKAEDKAVKSGATENKGR